MFAKTEPIEKALNEVIGLMIQINNSLDERDIENAKTLLENAHAKIREVSEYNGKIKREILASDDKIRAAFIKIKRIIDEL